MSIAAALYLVAMVAAFQTAAHGVCSLHNSGPAPASSASRSRVAARIGYGIYAIAARSRS